MYFAFATYYRLPVRVRCLLRRALLVTREPQAPAERCPWCHRRMRADSWL